MEKEKIKSELLSALLDSALLHKKDREVLTAFLVQDKTTKEVAEITKLTTFRVKQILVDAVHRVKLKLITLDKQFSMRGSMQEKIDSLMERVRRYEEREREINALPENRRKLLSVKLADIDFSIRLLNACQLSKINTVGDIVKLTKREFMSLRNVGRKSVDELDEFIHTKDLHWGMKI